MEEKNPKEQAHPSKKESLRRLYLKYRPYGVYLNILDLISERVYSRAASAMVFFTIAVFALQLAFSRNFVQPEHFSTAKTWFYIDPDGIRHKVYFGKRGDIPDDLQAGGPAWSGPEIFPAPSPANTSGVHTLGYTSTGTHKVQFYTLADYDRYHGIKISSIEGDGFWATVQRNIETFRVGHVHQRAHLVLKQTTIGSGFRSGPPIFNEDVPPAANRICTSKSDVFCVEFEGGRLYKLGFRESLLSLAVYCLPLFVANNDTPGGHRIWQSLLSFALLALLLVAALTGFGGHLSFRYRREFEATMFIMVYITITLSLGIFVYYVVCHLTKRQPMKPFRVTRQVLYRDLVKRLLRSQKRQTGADGNQEDELETRRLLAKEQDNRFKQTWYKIKYYMWSGGTKSVRLWKLSRSALERLGYLKVNRHQRFELKTDFFYPQRLTYAMLFSLWAGFFVAAVALFFMIPLTELVLKGLVTTETIDSGLYTILNTYIPIGLYASAMFTFATICAILYTIMKNYRRHIMLLRQGRYFFERELYGVTEVSRYIGYQTSHIGFTFVIVFILYVGSITFIVLLIVIPGFRSQVYDLVKQVGVSLLISVVLAAYLQRMFVALVFTKYNGTLIRHKNVYSVVDYGLMFYNVVQGVFVAVGRFAYALGCLFILMSRCDMSIFPRSLEDRDPAYRSYIAMLLADHRYNHPVLTIWGEVLDEHVQKLAQEREAVELDTIRVEIDGTTARPHHRHTIAARAGGKDGDKLINDTAVQANPPAPTTRHTLPAPNTGSEPLQDDTLHAAGSSGSADIDGRSGLDSGSTADDGGASDIDDNDNVPLSSHMHIQGETGRDSVARVGRRTEHQYQPSRHGRSGSSVGSSSSRYSAFFDSPELRARRARTRWFLAYTLINNPKLRPLRWHTLEQIAAFESQVDYSKKTLKTPATQE